MPSVDRRIVLDIFERHRAVLGAPFDESHFLDYLIADPKDLGAVRNSFSGLRRYNAFVDEVQLYFNVCLSIKDFEANHSVGQFVSRVGELQRSPKGSIASLRNQQRRGFGWGTVIVGNLLAACLLIAAWRVSPAVAYVLVVAAAIANVFVLKFFLRWRSYSQRLMANLAHAPEIDA
jgi:hypothetical protein